MKKIILLLVVLGFTKFGYSQTDFGQQSALLVSIDASIKALTGINTNMAGIMDADWAKKTANTAISFMDDMESVKKLLTLVEALVCQLEELKINISLVDNTCILNLNYSVSILNVQSSSDIIKYGLLAKNIFLNAGEKMNMLDRAISILEKSIADVGLLNFSLRFSFREFVMKKYTKKTLYPLNTGFVNKRY